MRGLIGAALLLASGVAHAAPPSALVDAYPDQLAAIAGDTLLWRDGTKMPLGDPAPRPFEVMLRSASLRDQLRQPYPAGAPLLPPAPDEDPGRLRNVAFFDHLYGDCHAGEVAPHLATVVWLPRHWGGTVRFSTVAGADRALSAVSAELDALPDAQARLLFPPAGTYNCRTVADTGLPSMHAYGAAIDLNTAYADSWFWHRNRVAAPVWHNRIPPAVVAAFEQHGFVWGGRWYHYDTMHFEYRPELLPALSR
jgi:hypothetical protein